MAKDYFQDILPAGENVPRRSLPVVPHPSAEPEGHDTHETNDDEVSIPTTPADNERSIRNISMPNRTRPRPTMDDLRDSVPQAAQTGVVRTFKKWWIWIIAVVSVLLLALLLIISLRSTTVTVVPRSHAVTFDQASQFIAYPAGSAASATGTLSYIVSSTDIEDSEVIESNGTVHAEEKASGSLTVYNDYQTSSYRLIKNTRFESADGKVFRTPAEIVIPGKSGSTPGQVTVTVVADQVGETYNVAAGKFTVPGLKSLSSQYAGIYAKSTSPMTGGFVGDKPGVAPGAREAAVSAVRARLENKARTTYAQEAGSVIFPDLMQITYEEMLDTAEAGGGVRIHEVAHVSVPVFPSSAFATAVYADANGAEVSIRPETGLSAHLLQEAGSLETGPIQFSLTGSATILWSVDSDALADALAGKQQDSFQAIATQFPGVLEARARIEPFWKSVFPTDPKAIKIDIQAVNS